MKKLSVLAALSFSLLLQGINIADYGAGPMLKPARTFYVSQKGNNKNDGRTLQTAFRTINRGVRELKAGDTLLIEGGRYFEPEIQINVGSAAAKNGGQNGRPGSPIRIMGMKGHKVMLVGGEIVKPLKRQGQLAEFPCPKAPAFKIVQELPSGIELQMLSRKELVKKFPGTYFFDPAKKKLLVHFAALGQNEVSIARRRVGMRIHGSYIHVENLEFRYFSEGLYARMNFPYDKNKASNITIRNCNFFWNFHCGAILDGTSWSLFKNNRGAFNTRRGNFMNLSRAHDNLFLGNWSGPAPRTLRHLPVNAYNYGINSYGGNPPRNHLIGNFVESENAFRWKGGCPHSVVRDNIFLGNFHSESKVIPALIHNNVFTGRISYTSLGGNIWEKEFAKTPIKFYGNCRKIAQFKPLGKEILAAQKLKIDFPAPRFPKVIFKDLKVSHIAANTAVVTWETPDNDGWGDVQIWKKGSSGKRWISGPGVQGVEHAVGLDRLSPGTEYCYRAFFRSRRGGKRAVSAAGTFRTALKNPPPRILEAGKGKLSLLEAGCAALPGDTVKLLPGTYTGQLLLLNSGRKDKPITITGDRKAVIDGARFYAPLVTAKWKSHIIIDGITFADPDPDAGKGIIFLYGGSHITIKNCRTTYFPYTAGGFIRSNNTPVLRIENNLIHGGDYPLNLSAARAKILNNTIVDATMLSLLLWSPVDVEIRNNIFYRPCVPGKRNPALLMQDIKGKVVSEGNIYWSPVKAHPAGGVIRDNRAKVLFASKTLDEWQKKTGMDKSSRHIDPRFKNYKKRDFRLAPDSPAKGKGAEL